ncbi:MAG TPA: YdeI/OmpD-associated family protein [Pricia sp.]|nr:YdeI/OmpD-associated family protein [Pricia sp.]
METKTGMRIPKSLAIHLGENNEFKNAWKKLRPSCQRDYVIRVNKAPTEKKRKDKIERIIQLTLEYAERHPEKYKKRQQ